MKVKGICFGCDTEHEIDTNVDTKNHIVVTRCGGCGSDIIIGVGIHYMMDDSDLEKIMEKYSIRTNGFRTRKFDKLKED